MTAVSRNNMPPSTPVHLGGLRRDRVGLAAASLDSRGQHNMVDVSPTQDSPLPPAPVSAFIVDEESEEDAQRTAEIAARSNAASVVAPHPRKAAPRARSTLNRAARDRPPLSDEDSPGVGRRAPPISSSSSSRLDDLGIPRASYLLQNERSRISGSRSSPIVKGDEALGSTYPDRRSSPGNGPTPHGQPQSKAAQASAGRFRGAHAPVSSSNFAKIGESSRPSYGSLGRSSSYGNGEETLKEDGHAQTSTRSSMNAIVGNSESRRRPSSAADPDPFNRRTSRTPPSEARAQHAVPRRRSFEEHHEELDLDARALAPQGSEALALSSRAGSRNGYRRGDGPQELDGNEARRSAARRPSDEKESLNEHRRVQTGEGHGDLEAMRRASLTRPRSPLRPAAAAQTQHPGADEEDNDHQNNDDEDEGQRQGPSERSPPQARFKSDQRGGTDPSGAASAAATSGYRTPAMGGRALRSSLAASNGVRSAGRSLRKLARSSNHHVPARRVQRYQDEEEEDEDLDDDAKGKGDNESGSGESPRSAEHRIAEDGSGGGGSGGKPDEQLHASGGSSGSGSRGHSDDDGRNGNGPQLRAYGYDPIQAKTRAELLERASLVRSPSPKLYHQGDRDDDGLDGQADGSVLQPPPPSRKEQHPNARRAPSGENMARKENLEPAAARKRTAGANAMHDIMAAKVPAPGGQGPVARRGIPAEAPNPGRSALTPAAVQNQAKAGAAPLVPSSLPPAPDGTAEGDEEIDEEVYRQYSDCRPDLIWGEADRQLEQPLANHANLMELVKGPPKATAMQGLKYRKVKKAGRGGFSVVWVVRGPLYEPSPASPQEMEEVPEERQAFFALKQVSLKEVESEQNRQELISEANTLRTLANLEGSEKYLLRYFGHRVSNDKLKILLELGDGDFNGILATQAPLSRDLIAHYWREMLEAVQFIHDVNLVHTDLKPANFLIVKNRIKLIDFGIAQNIPKGTVHISRDAIIGTPNYMAPEAIKIAKAKGRRVYKAGKPSDVWSLGCILYQMIWGRPPFDKLPSDRKLEGIMDPHHRIAYPPCRDPRYADVEDVDAAMLDCVQSALQYRVEDRATIPQLLSHPFLRPSSQHEATRRDDDDDDLDETVRISRGKLRDLVGRLRVLALRDELTEDNVVERADLLFNNLRQAQQ